MRVHHDVYGATCPKHCGPHIHLNIDIDLFPQLGVRGGGHHEVYGDICSKHWVPFPHLNIDMDTLPQLGVRGGGHHENVRGHVSQTPAQFNIRRYGVQGGGHDEVHRDICPIHWRPYPDSNIDMDPIPHLAIQATCVPNTGGLILT